VFSAGLADGLGDEPDDGFGLAFEGLKFELGAGLFEVGAGPDDRTGALLLVAGVVVAVGLVVPAELAPLVRLDVFFADPDAADPDPGDPDAGGHACVEQGITGLVLTPLLAVSRTTTTAIAVTRTVGKMTAQK
jgi:hypothetical protein